MLHDTRAFRYRRLHDQLSVVLKEPHPLEIPFLRRCGFGLDLHVKDGYTHDGWVFGCGECVVFVVGQGRTRKA